MGLKKPKKSIKTKKTSRQKRKKNDRREIEEAILERHKRQQDIYDPAEAQRAVTIVGVGNIGSHVALALARLGIEYITLYDFDYIEAHNTTSQAYTISDVGKNKVDVIKDEMVRINPDCIISAIVGKYVANKEDILIIAVDSMKARQKIYKSLKKTPPKIIIDARIGGDQLEVYTMLTMDEWATKLNFAPDKDPCGGRYICYTSIMVGAIITNQVKRILKNEEIKKEVLFHFATYDIIVT